MNLTPDELQCLLQNLIESGTLTKDDVATLMQAANNPEALELMISKLREGGADQVGSGAPLDMNQYYRDGTNMFELRWPLQASLPIAFDQLDRKTQFFVLFQEWSRRELEGMTALNSGQTDQAKAIFAECLERAQQLQINELIARSYEGFMRIAQTLGDTKAERTCSGDDRLRRGQDHGNGRTLR